jgi:hypothetical protein
MSQTDTNQLIEGKETPMRRVIDLSVGSRVDSARFILDLQGVCDFPVRLEVLVNKEYTLTFPTDADGTTRQLVNGRLVIRFTNLLTSTSVTRNVSGPGETLFYPNDSNPLTFPNTLTARGAWAIFFFPDVLGPGTPGALFINHGLIVIHTEADGFHQSVLNQVGTQEDLCAALD